MRHLWIHGWIIGLLGTLVAVPGAEAQPRQRCAAERATAEAHYLEGRFDEAALLLRACIEQNPLFVEEAVEVYRLLGLVYLYDDAPGEATDAVRTLLGLAPGYTPDAVQDPPSYVALVEAVRAQLRSEPALAPPEEAPREETAAEEITEDDPPPLMPPPGARLDPQQQPEGTPPLGLRRAKTWLLATGGAVVVFTAALLAVGG